jgi:hypothetical protein
MSSAPGSTRTVSGRKVVGTFLAILALCLVAYGFERWRVLSERDAARAREAARRARTTTVDAR